MKVTIILSVLPEGGIFSILPAPLRDPSYVPTAVVQRCILPDAQYYRFGLAKLASARIGSIRRVTGNYTEGRQVLVFGVVLCMSEARSRLKK